MMKFWWRWIATLVGCALAEVCTIPVLLVHVQNFVMVTENCKRLL